MGIKKDGWISIKDIKKNPSNPRIIKDKGFNKLQDSLSSERGKEHFEARPCIVSNRTGENIIIAGNTRYQAAKDLGWEEVPCVILENLTEEQENEIIIRDNVSNGEWDWEELANAWDHESLLEWGLELPDTIELEPEEVKEDDYNEEPPKEPVTKRGDIYELGEHRVMCGDSTMIDDVEKLMNGEKADVVVTDPPYNTGMTAQTQAGQGGTLWKGNKKNGGKAWLSHMFNDSYTDDEWEDFMNLFISSCYSIGKDDHVAYIFLDWRRSHELIPYIKNYYKLSNLIIWDKVVHGLGSDYKYTHEFLHVCKKGNPVLDTHQGDREYSDVWHIQRKLGKDEDHATKKPVELLVRPIKHSTKKGNIVADIFLGSGSTLIACEQTNRKCYGMELDEKYCDVIVRRYVKYCNDNDKEPIVKLNGKVLNSLEMYE